MKTVKIVGFGALSDENLFQIIQKYTPQLSNESYINFRVEIGSSLNKICYLTLNSKEAADIIISNLNNLSTQYGVLECSYYQVIPETFGVLISPQFQKFEEKQQIKQTFSDFNRISNQKSQFSEGYSSDMIFHPYSNFSKNQSQLQNLDLLASEETGENSSAKYNEKDESGKEKRRHHHHRRHKSRTGNGHKHRRSRSRSHHKKTTDDKTNDSSDSSTYSTSSSSYSSPYSTNSSYSSTESSDSSRSKRRSSRHSSRHRRHHSKTSSKRRNES